jgi:hypothetical protein
MHASFGFVQFNSNAAAVAAIEVRVPSLCAPTAVLYALMPRSLYCACCVLSRSLTRARVDERTDDARARTHARPHAQCALTRA